MNGHGAILLAIVALVAAGGAEALRATEPAWRGVVAADWAHSQWTYPPICTGVELTVGCVPADEVPAARL